MFGDILAQRNASDCLSSHSPLGSMELLQEGVKHPKAPCLNTLLPLLSPLCSRDIRKGMRAVLTNTEGSVTALCPVSSQTAKSNSWKNLMSV